MPQQLGNLIAGDDPAHIERIWHRISRAFTCTDSYGATANAISGIALVGALVVTAAADGGMVEILGVIAIVMATINVVGGFMVTDRMLSMFKKS